MVIRAMQATRDRIGSQVPCVSFCQRTSTDISATHEYQSFKSGRPNGIAGPKGAKKPERFVEQVAQNALFGSVSIVYYSVDQSGPPC